jgi:cold shock CspA family protein
MAPLAFLREQAGLSISQEIQMNLTATITTWYPDAVNPWGFATTPDEQTVYIHESAFFFRCQVHQIRVGDRIEFDLRREKCARMVEPVKMGEQLFLDSFWPECRATVGDKKPHAVNIKIISKARMHEQEQVSHKDKSASA